VSAIGARLNTDRVVSVARWAGWIALAFVLFGAVLLVSGRDPLRAYADMLTNTLGSSFGASEVLVKMIPLVLTALAVALPARIGLVNVGAEGQLFMGGYGAALAAFTFSGLPAWALLPLMTVFAFAAGALWAGVTAVLRARGWLNEVFSTLLLNYVAILFVDAVVYGPWRDPGSANYPQSPLFVPAGDLPTFFGTRVHAGILFAIVAVIAAGFVLARTRFGLEMRAIGGNVEAARRNGIPIERYIVVVMVIAGGIAGLAGMGEASGINHRLTPGLSPGYGFIGFLISWLAGHRPFLVPVMALVLAVFAVGGDILQITQGLPYAAVNILMALILFTVLAARARGRAS
jgi:ABC-type uncharacterized transport system permease subunit